MWFKVFLQSSDERQVDCRSWLKISAVCSMFLWHGVLVSYWICSSMTMCLASSTRCQQEFFRGRNFVRRNFHDLVLDCENRENFCLMKISRCTCAYVWDIHSGILWLIHEQSHFISADFTYSWHWYKQTKSCHWNTVCMSALLCIICSLISSHS